MTTGNFVIYSNAVNSNLTMRYCTSLNGEHHLNRKAATAEKQGWLLLELYVGLIELI